jgi:glycosyltransferase involved in cell wall biosynthesis
MSLNVPVVVNDKCALPETAGDAAIVIKGNDPKSFADGLHQTIDSITYVKAGKDHYREKFHRSAVAKTFITAFEAVR